MGSLSEKQRQWLLALAAFGVCAFDTFLLWSLGPSAVEVARQSLFHCLVLIMMIALPLMALTIGVTLIVQNLLILRDENKTRKGE